VNGDGAAPPEGIVEEGGANDDMKTVSLTGFLWGADSSGSTGAIGPVGFFSSRFDDTIGALAWSARAGITGTAGRAGAAGTTGRPGDDGTRAGMGGIATSPPETALEVPKSSAMSMDMSLSSGVSASMTITTSSSMTGFPRAAEALPTSSISASGKKGFSMLPSAPTPRTGSNGFPLLRRMITGMPESARSCLIAESKP
jgi:hypothetical protein